MHGSYLHHGFFPLLFVSQKCPGKGLAPNTPDSELFPSHALQLGLVLGSQFTPRPTMAPFKVIIVRDSIGGSALTNNNEAVNSINSFNERGV